MPKRYLGVGREYENTRVLEVADPTGPQDAATKSYVDTRAPTAHAASHRTGGSDPLVVVATPSSPSNGGTLTIDASTGALQRISTTVAGFTLAVPTNPVDGNSMNIEIAATNAFSLILNGSIVLTTGITTPIAVAAGKRLFLGLRAISSTWYLLASTTSS